MRDVGRVDIFLSNPCVAASNHSAIRHINVTYCFEDVKRILLRITNMALTFLTNDDEVGRMLNQEFFASNTEVQ